MPNLKVLICDDSQLMCLGLTHTLKQVGFSEIEHAFSGAEAISKIVDSSPDVVLMDLLMPEMSGIEATKQLMKNAPNTKVLMVTSSDDPRHVLDSLRAGAVGYCLKTIRPLQLSLAIQAVATGAGWLDPNVAGKVLPLLTKGLHVPRSFSPNPTAVSSLTEREYQVLTLMAEGLSNVEIAAELFVSPQTVKTHVRHVFEKMVAKDRTDAVVKALRSGLIRA